MVENDEQQSDPMCEGEDTQKDLSDEPLSEWRALRGV